MTPTPTNRTIGEIVRDEIERLQKEVERLRAALEWIAEADAYLPKNHESMRAFCKAREALGREMP